MGVQISDLIPKKQIKMEYLSGKRIAIDAFLFLHQFLSIIRQPDGTPLRDSKGRITSHLSGIFYRSAKLIEAGIKPIYVFDGQRPEFKRATTQARIEARKQAKEKWEKALKEGKTEEARKYAQASSHLTKEMVEQSKELLSYMGIPVIQAPSEGEAQCAAMCKQKLVYSVASQDSDSLLFGAPRLIRNLSITGKRKVPRKHVYIEIKPELIELKQTLKELNISQTQLIILGLLVGTDYNKGIFKIGPKTALKIVKEYKKLDKIIEKATEKNPWIGPDPESILDFFKNPPTKKIKSEQLESGEIKPEKILKIMIDDFGFSQIRIENAVERLTKKPEQHSLGKWLK